MFQKYVLEDDDENYSAQIPEAEFSPNLTVEAERAEAANKLNDKTNNTSNANSPKKTDDMQY